LLDLGLVSGFLGNATNIVQMLKEEKIVSHEGLIIFHDESEVQYRLDLNIGDYKSRMTKFKNFFKSRSLQPVTIEALEASGNGMQNENLLEMGLMKWEGTNLIIDFPRILREVNSSLVIIIFRTRFSTELRDKLIHRQVSTINSIKDGKIVANFELVLDYANMWYSNFTSFSVRNIVFTMTHQLPPNDITKAAMDELAQKLDNADKLALKKENARKFLTEFQKTILELQEPEFLSRIQGMLEVTPVSNGKIIGVTPILKVYSMIHSKIPLTIPDVFELIISANIEDRDTAIHGTISFDLDEFRKGVKEKLKMFKQRNKKLKF